MEDEVMDYIKRMFGTQRPEWLAEHEGLLLYDTVNHVWLGGDNIGWVEISELGD